MRAKNDSFTSKVIIKKNIIFELLPCMSKVKDYLGSSKVN